MFSKKEIHKYLIDNDWDGDYYDMIYRGDEDVHDGAIIDMDNEYFSRSESKKSRIFNMRAWDIPNGEYYDKYLLEYIGHILRKYKIREVWVSGQNWKYMSDKWTFNTILSYK